MERIKQRRALTPTSIGGNQQIQKQKTVPKLGSESSSCSRGTPEEDLYIFDTGKSSSKRVIGTPMKKLLAEEMSKETIAKKRSPSVIAKLMGLDGLPSPQPVHRQQRRLPDNYTQRTASTGVQRNGKLYDGRSDRKSSMDQQEFKDVYEDPEASHVANRCKSSKQSPNANLTKQQLAFIRKRCDEMVWESEKNYNKIERVDSNTDLMLKFLQQPDSLFVKHLHDQQGIHSSSLCSHIAVLKPSNSVKYEAGAKGRKAERATSRKHDTGTHRRHEGGNLGYSSSRGTHSSLKSSKIQIDGNEEIDIPPTRIVVLKPNLGMTRDAIQTVSSPDDHRKHEGYSSSTTGEAGSWGNKGLPNEVVFSRPKSKEPKEIAKEITRRMRESFGSGHVNMLYSGVRGYVGDESSYNMSESDSASESEVITLTSKNSYDWSDRHKPLPSGSTESFVSREAKKRLSERWKMTRGYEDVEVVGKGSTLGEMLAVPDREIRPENLDAVMGLDGASNKFACTAGLVTPLGISSRDGWRDGYLRSASRSSCLPPSSGSRSHITSAYRDVLVDERLLMHREATDRGRSEAVKENFNRRDKNLKYNSKKFQSSRQGNACSTGSTHSLPESCSSQNTIEINFENEEPAEPQPLIFHTPDSATRTTSVVDAVTNTEISSESSNELLPELSTSMLGDEVSSALDQDDSNPQELSIGKPEEGSVSLQFPGLEPESSESSKEADHPSPVSVLEVSSIEDVSSGSDCFERVNSDLHELRMHLQLLKMESEASYEVPMLNSSEEEEEQGSVIASGGKRIVGSDSWESSYLVDVLIDSGFYDTDPDLFMTTWYSPDCPFGPWLFDSLEKKYSDEATGPRSERKLLYDHINVAFLELSQWSMNSCPWVNPVRIGVGLKWQKLGVEDRLHRLLASQVKEANEDISEKVLDKEMYWLESCDGIDLVGKEIEELLINDLILEVLTM